MATSQYEAVIGLEVHAELLTQSKMFCGCAVVDSTQAAPNTCVCPVCAGLPGTLPVINARAVEFALRVALALNCAIPAANVFARKNYFYPDLPKGYQISQYELPLGVNGWLDVETAGGVRRVGIRRVHLERARILLATTALSIAEVAERAGFSDNRHLCVEFRQETGLTPTAYRRQFRRPGVPTLAPMSWPGSDALPPTP